jgi:ribose-phosphate pyrophosphokinase
VLHFSHALNLRTAVASKHRPRPEETVVSEVAGDLTNARVAIVLDDMISTGGTLYAVIERLVQEQDIQEVYIGVSHNLCIESARERLLRLHQDYNLRQVIVTNTIPQTPAFLDLPFLSVRSLAERFARMINQVHYNRPLAELVR